MQLSTCVGYRTGDVGVGECLNLSKYVDQRIRLHSVGCERYETATEAPVCRLRSVRRDSLWDSITTVVNVYGKLNFINFVNLLRRWVLKN